MGFCYLGQLGPEEKVGEPHNVFRGFGKRESVSCTETCRQGPLQGDGAKVWETQFWLDTHFLASENLREIPPFLLLQEYQPFPMA